MLTTVNATRMELLHLRKRVALAARGHRLLSEKRDELSHRLIQIARQIKPLREKVEKELLKTPKIEHTVTKSVEAPKTKVKDGRK